jgi:uncharacterized protein (DUF1684 family)
VNGKPTLGPVALAALVLAACTGDSRQGPGPDYAAEIERQRAERVERLRAPDGWLSLVGLHWLGEGHNRFGSAEENEIILTGDDRTPPLAGTLVYEAGRVRILPDESAEIRIGGEPIEGARVLRDDSAAAPDVVELGRLRFHVIARGGRHALRIKDPESPTRLEFRGIEFFPVDPAYRVEARLRTYDSPQPREVATVTGTTARMFAPGTLEFEILDRTFSLEPFVGEPGETDLFLMFKDRTSGRETYGAGRYLSATLEGERAVLDFNQAYNPPCAFSKFATCPLPPGENRLDVEIRAGEKLGH